MLTEDPCHLPEEQFRSIAELAGQRTTVGELLEWAREEPQRFLTPGVLTDVVVQDEFTHDVVVQVAGGVVLVYDST
jgi:hypothetical protein